MKRKRLTHAERKAQTRERLIEAARALFIEKGFLSTSVAEVVEAAGYTRGAFYANFDEKLDLLMESLRQKGEAVGETRRAVLKLRDALHGDDGFVLWVEACLLAKRDAVFRERFDSFLTRGDDAPPVHYPASAMGRGSSPK